MSKYIKLNNCIDEYIAGDWGKEEISDNYTQKVLCVRGTDLNDLNSSNIDKIPVRYILSKNRDKILNNGNIIIEISGGSPKQSTGRIGYIDNITEDIICSNFCKALKIKDNFYPKFIFYALKNIYNSNIFFNFESKTTGIKNLLIDVAFDCIKIKNYNFFDQKAIANILSTLDQKIAINHQINAQLEQMTKTLYDYWFVQFDFPDENGKPYKSSGGEMVYNHTLKREIPKGWEVKSLGEVISLERGVTYSKESVCSNHKNATGILRATNISGNVIDLNDLVFISDEIDNRQKLQPFDILIVMSSGSKEHIGKNGIYYFEQENAFGAFCSKIKPKNGYFEFVATFLQSSNFKGYIKNQCLGTNINNLNNSHILNCKTVSPANNIIDLFHASTKSTYEKISCNAKQNQQLAQLRDFLLPMLMNGQVGVKDD